MLNEKQFRDCVMAAAKVVLDTFSAKMKKQAKRSNPFSLAAEEDDFDPGQFLNSSGPLDLLWRLSRPDTECDEVDLMPGFIDKLGEDTVLPFLRECAHYVASTGDGAVIMAFVHVTAPESAKGRDMPPELLELIDEAMESFNVATESRTDIGGGIINFGNQMDDGNVPKGLKEVFDKHAPGGERLIDREVAKFSDELDGIFGAWKGGET